MRTFLIIVGGLATLGGSLLVVRWLGPGGRTPFATTTGQFPGAVTGSGSSVEASSPLNIFLYNAKLNVGLTIQDLEQKQILQVLAEPTLILVLVGISLLAKAMLPFVVNHLLLGSASAYWSPAHLFLILAFFGALQGFDRPAQSRGLPKQAFVREMNLLE